MSISDLKKNKPHCLIVATLGTGTDTKHDYSGQIYLYVVLLIILLIDFSILFLLFNNLLYM